MRKISCLESKTNVAQWKDNVSDLYQVMQAVKSLFLFLEHGNEALLRVGVEIVACKRSRRVAWWEDGWYEDDAKREYLRSLVKTTLAAVVRAQELPPAELDDDVGGNADIVTQLEEEVDVLRQRAEAAQAALEIARQQLRLAENQCREAIEAADSAVARTKALESEVQKANQQWQDVQSAANDQSQSWASMVEELRSKLKREEEQRSELQCQLQESQLQLQLQMLEARPDEPAPVEPPTQDNSEKLEELRHRLHATEQAFAACESQLRQAQVEFQTAEADLRRKVAAAEAQVGQLREQNAAQLKSMAEQMQQMEEESVVVQTVHVHAVARSDDASVDNKVVEMAEQLAKEKSAASAQQMAALQSQLQESERRRLLSQQHQQQCGALLDNVETKLGLHVSPTSCPRDSQVSAGSHLLVKDGAAVEAGGHDEDEYGGFAVERLRRVDCEIASLIARTEAAENRMVAAEARATDFEGLDRALLEAKERARLAEEKLASAPVSVEPAPVMPEVRKEVAPPEAEHPAPIEELTQEPNDSAEVEEQIANMRVRLAKRDDQIAKLKKANEELDGKHQRMLRVLEGVREQLRRVTELAERRGCGKVVKQLLEDSEAVQALNDEEYTCFERLYEDALRRMEQRALWERRCLTSGGDTKSSPNRDRCKDTDDRAAVAAAGHHNRANYATTFEQPVLGQQMNWQRSANSVPSTSIAVEAGRMKHQRLPGRAPEAEMSRSATEPTLPLPPLSRMHALGATEGFRQNGSSSGGAAGHDPCAHSLLGVAAFDVQFSAPRDGDGLQPSSPMPGQPRQLQKKPLPWVPGWQSGGLRQQKFATQRRGWKEVAPSMTDSAAATLKGSSFGVQSLPVKAFPLGKPFA